MGITNSNALFLASAKKNGVDFAKVLTIGHQQLYVDEQTLVHLASYLEIDIDTEAVLSDPYIDTFLRLVLGAADVDSIDYSDYEKCDIVHDLNLPVGGSLIGQYDVVIDGGCLEHIFNVSTAFENYMKMVRPSGHLFVFTMANNHAGHGLYQLSPDFFYAALQESTGYQVDRMVLEEHPSPAAELGTGHVFYEVPAREAVKGRISFASRHPVIVMAHAKRVGETVGFRTFPIQPSYLDVYSAQKTATPAAAPSVGRRRTGIMVMVRSVLRFLRGLFPEDVQSRWEGERQLRTILLGSSPRFKKITLP